MQTGAENSEEQNCRGAPQRCLELNLDQRKSLSLITQKADGARKNLGKNQGEKATRPKMRRDELTKQNQRGVREKKRREGGYAAQWGCSAFP